MKRRVLLLSVPTTMLAAVASGPVGAQAAELAETDPEAIAVAYKTDASRVEPARNPKYKPGQTCLNCGLFLPIPDSKPGGCQLFMDKLVAPAGWCNSWESRP